LKDELLNSVLDATTAKDCWDRLASCYEGKGEQRIVHLIGEVFCKTLFNSEALEPQINALIRVAHTISNLGLKLNDKLVTWAIISSLPSSLSTLKTILSTSSPADLSPVYILSQVTLDEQHCIWESGIGATAFFAKAAQRAKGKDKKSEEKSKKHCTHCKIQGHNVSECCKLKRECEAKGGTPGTTPKHAPSSTTSAKVATTDSEMSDSSVHLFSTHVSETQPSEESIHAFQALPALNLQHKWIMDSGASHTMSSNHHWFHIFTHLSTPITIFLGDNSTIHATGIGHIHVHMQANQEWHHAILQDVLFVPDLHGNLLSVTHVTRCGANIQFVGQACHILDQQGNLTCEGCLQGNLYLMDIHTTVLESAQIACVEKFPANEDKPPAHALVAHSMTATADVDTWHCCLGYLHIDSVL
jgi:Pol polyprotein/LTR polyprotein gag-polypeptide-like protein